MKPITFREDLATKINELNDIGCNTECQYCLCHGSLALYTDLNVKRALRINCVFEAIRLRQKEAKYRLHQVGQTYSAIK